MVKLTNANILSAFRKQVGITKKEELAFSDAFQSVFEEALLRDKILKINGLGTFKLLPVGARKSIDVNTGEKIEIAEHYKITFTPEVQLRDKVNQPLAHLETIELSCDDFQTTPTDEDTNITTENLVVENIPSTSDIETISDQDDSPLQKLVEQAIELKELLSDIQSIGIVSNDENVSNNEPQNIEQQIETNQANLEPKTEETLITSKSEPIVKESTKPKTERNSISDEDIISAINSENDFSDKRSTRIWILIAIILFVVIIALLIYKNRDFFTLNNKTNQSTESIVENIDTTQVDTIDAEQQLVAEVLGQEIINSDTVNIIEEQHQNDTTSIYCNKFSDIFNYKREYVEFVDTITLNGGKRLTLVSLEYYGHKDFWVYIYEANKDAIQHPNSVKAGVKLRIPKILPELIDTSNPETIEYARYLHDIYIKK